MKLVTAQPPLPKVTMKLVYQPSPLPLKLP